MDRGCREAPAPAKELAKEFFGTELSTEVGLKRGL